MKLPLNWMAQPNVAVEEVPFLGSHFGLETDRPDTGGLFFSSVHPGRYVNSISNYVVTVSFYISFRSLLASHPTLQCYIICCTDSLAVGGRIILEWILER
jgi:hypothetical protein